MNLLLVEDDSQAQKLFRTAIKEFNEDNNISINYSICSTVAEALDKLKEEIFDGAIIDLKLGDESDGGNQVTEQIKNTFNRIPIIFVTGTPDAVNTDDIPLVRKYTRDSVSYCNVIQELYDIYNTGLTKIMGGAGVIEEKLSRIFINNLLPQFSAWVEYGKVDPKNTEKAYLRHALNHLLQDLDRDVDVCHPEEFYIYPPISDRINTGSILKKKDSSSYFIVMNPACDLAERTGGGCNTDQALLIEIEILKTIYPDLDKDNFSLETLSNTLEGKLKGIYENKKSYYHWLPLVHYFNGGVNEFKFKGGVINFRKISTYTSSELEEEFDPSPAIQVSPGFIKDIVSRFSSYYARQGQPDINFSKYLKQ